MEREIWTIDNYLTKRLLKNQSQIVQYYVEDSHEAIIPKDECDAVQEKIARRRAFSEERHMNHYGYGYKGGPYTSKSSAHCVGNLTEEGPGKVRPSLQETAGAVFFSENGERK